jgi:signal transduction histidine kinase
MTAVRRSEDELRALTKRVVQVQEAERGRVSLELHENITQLLCAIQFRSQSLVDRLPARAGSARAEAETLRDMLGDTVKEVERIAHNLRPSVLDQLGLSAALREICTEFSTRTGLVVTLACEQLAGRLPADTELALYRILEIALKDVEQHARARAVNVALTQSESHVELVIRDDGVGFDPQSPRNKTTARDGIGLLSMRERTRYVGGVMTVKSSGRTGTEVEVRVSLAPGAKLEA